MNDAYAAARQQIGTWEWKGDDHNPKIVKWFADVGHDWVADDETAWCAAFVGAMLKAGGFPHTGALNARSYEDYGDKVVLEAAQPGDIVVLSRGASAWQGHVGFFVRRDGDDIVVLGGNQANQVNESRYPVRRLLAVRRPKAQRTSKAQSTTLQATAAAGVSGVTGVATAMSKLDGTAQMIVIGAAVVAALALAWIARERIKRWARGDR